MAISPKCDKCNKDLTDFGAVFISPPNDDDAIFKYHLCKNCWCYFCKWLETK